MPKGMGPGVVVEIVRGEYAGHKGMVRNSESFFYTLQLLTPSGKKSLKGVINVHRTAIKAVSPDVPLHTA